MFRRFNFRDNAPQESFFDHMKDEIKGKIIEFSSFDEVKAIIDDWIDCYNNDRCIWHLNKFPPKEFNETGKKIALLQWEDIIADSI